jgi:ABC-2 type transport system permease protein
VLYMINGFRYSLYGVSDISFVHSLAIVTIFLVVLFSFALYLLNKGIGIKS